jgi:hypothetical protein
MFNRIANYRWTPAVILAIGLALRLAWLWNEGGKEYAYAEAGNVAYALYSTGQFADAFRPGQGPTAHLMPLAPMIAAAFYKAFGYGTAAADWALSLWSIALVLSAFWLQFKTFVLLGLPRWAALAALAFLCIVPLNFALEVAWFRVWEGSLGVALASLLVYLLVKWHGEPYQPHRLYVGAVLLGLLFFVQPPLGLAAICASIFYGLLNLSPVQFLKAAAATILAVMVFLTPWAMRNKAALGEYVFLRSNLGLELAVGFYPGAVWPSDPETTHWNRMRDIHPATSDVGYAKMQKGGGEIAYSEHLRHASLIWMRDHPAGTVRLMARHAAEMLFPPEWFFKGAKQVRQKVMLHWLISALGIAGIFTIPFLRSPRLLYPAILVAVTIMPYALVQPTARYRYLIFSLIVFYGAMFAALAFRLIRWRQLQPSMSVPSHHSASPSASLSGLNGEAQVPSPLSSSPPAFPSI